VENKAIEEKDYNIAVSIQVAQKDTREVIKPYENITISHPLEAFSVLKVFYTFNTELLM